MGTVQTLRAELEPLEFEVAVIIEAGRHHKKGQT
jgi:hypothetical protein